MTRLASLLILLALCGGGIYAQQTVTAKVAETEATFSVPIDPKVADKLADLERRLAAAEELHKKLDARVANLELKLTKLGQVEILPVTAPTIKLQSVMQ